MQNDPVRGMMVDEKKTKLTSKHGDKTFYFCSASCKTTFDKDSHRYGHAQFSAQKRACRRMESRSERVAALPIGPFRSAESVRHS